jgi:hypothetical protein
LDSTTRLQAVVIAGFVDPVFIGWPSFGPPSPGISSQTSLIYIKMFFFIGKWQGAMGKSSQMTFDFTP